MILNLNEDVSKEMFDKIVVAFNSLKKEDEILDIYLSSPGGSVDSMEGIIDFINRRHSNIRLFAYGDICSAAFDIFFRTKCFREVLPGTMGMAHFTGVYVVSLGIGGGARKLDDKASIAWAENSKKECIELYSKLGFNKKELDKIRKGEDVWFLTDRLRMFLSKTITSNAEHK